jgi:hypothetical protein
MNDQTRKLLVKKLETIAKGAGKPCPGKSCQGVTGPVRYILSDGIAFELSNELVDLFEEIVQIILKQQDWNEKFSEKYIETGVQSLIAKALRDGTLQTIPIHLSDFESSLNQYNKKQTVYVPIHGILMSIPSLTIGNINLKLIGNIEFTQLLERIENIVHSLKATQEEREAFLNMERLMLEKNIRGHVCAEFTVIAEPTRAQERAEEEARRVLDLLRYSIHFLYSDSFQVYVGLQGEVIYTPRVVPVISADGRSFSIQQSISGSLHPFEINQPNIDRMDKIGVFKLSKLLTKKDRALTDFERTILRSVHWFASAQVQQEPENKFVNLITCLESFLTPRDGNPIGTAIAEAVAILLADTVDKRKRLKKKMLELYRLRSAVSHGGQKAILDSQLHILKTIAGLFLMLMIENIDGYQSREDLLDWIESKKLSAK